MAELRLGENIVVPAIVIKEGAEINNQDKTITQNGQYTADEGYTGLGTVTVNVPGSTAFGVTAEELLGSVEEGPGYYIKPSLDRVVFSGIVSIFDEGPRLVRTSVREVEFPDLAEIIGPYPFAYAFENCNQLEKVSFPSLIYIESDTLSTFGIASASYMFRGCSALREIHFKAEVQEMVESTRGYTTNWGAANAIIYFDL